MSPMAVRLVEFMDSRSPEAEVYRALRTKIKLLTYQRGIKTIAVTSPWTGDGKTTVCVNLGVSMAQSGSKVLIIDGNLRSPALHRIFMLSNSVGLTNILSQKACRQSLISCSGIKNLDIVLCGPKPPNPSEMLDIDRLKGFLEAVRKDYDYILMDTAPIVEITDGMMLSSVCDGTILVLVLGETSTENALKARELLKNANAGILGIVLNKAGKLHPVYNRSQGAVNSGVVRRNT